MANLNNQNKSDLQSADDQAWLAAVKDEVEGLRFGTVQVIIHEGQVVQIERISRRRIGTSPALPRHLTSRSAKQTTTGN